MKHVRFLPLLSVLPCAAENTQVVEANRMAEVAVIRCNPAVATPGLQLTTAKDLKRYWRSDPDGELSNGVLSRPAVVIAQP
jgi:hypothetical protein